MSSLFNNIDDVDAAKDYNDYLTTGHYLGRIERVRSFEGQDGSDKVVADITILHVFEDSETPQYAEEGSPTEWIDRGQAGLHRPGTEVSQFWTSKFKSAQRNLKAFLASAVGCAESDITASACKQIVEDNLLGGEVVEIVGRSIATKKGSPFTKVVCKRNVPASEFAEVVDEKILARFFPNLDELIAAEDE